MDEANPIPLETRNLPPAKGVYSPHWGDPSELSPLYTDTTDATNTLTLMHQSRDGESKLAGTPSASCPKSNTIASVILMLQRRPLLAGRTGWITCTTTTYPDLPSNIGGNRRMDCFKKHLPTPASGRCMVSQEKGGSYASGCPSRNANTAIQ